MTPPWPPRAEHELRAAEANGILDKETHFLDFKWQVPSGKGANKELARDLTSFSIDGGVLLIGVRDLTDRPPALDPVEFEGLSERVEQVALSAIDPSLYVETHSIGSAGNPQLGWVVVEIPPSQDAPHQVEGTYYGRGDKTKRKLPDREVEALIALRRSELEDVAGLLQLREVEVPHSLNMVPSIDGQPTITLVATPRPGRRDMTLDSVPDGHYATWLRQVLLSESPDERRPHVTPLSEMREVSPDESRRHDGWRLGYDYRPQAIDVWLDESGEVTLFCSHVGTSSDRSDDMGIYYNEFEILGLTVQFAHLVDRISRDAGYNGKWDLGLSLTGLAGRRALTVIRRGGNPGPGFPDGETYRELTSAPASELHKAAHCVADRLVARFVRIAGIDGLQAVNETLRRPPHD